MGRNPGKSSYSERVLAYYRPSHKPNDFNATFCWTSETSPIFLTILVLLPMVG
jgi:hypothetical protein